jgi:hypothetical protein
MYPRYPDIYEGEHFVPGQLIKCIDNRSFELFIGNERWQDLGEYLKINKIYKVTRFLLICDRAKVYVDLENGSESWYYPDRFIALLKDQRKRKLKKIMNDELEK